MKISVSSWSFTNSGFRNIEEIIDAARECGVEALDLTLDDYVKYYDWPNRSEEEIRAHFTAVREYGEKKGVGIFQTHAPFTAFPHYLKRDFFDLTVKAIAATSAVGAKYCVFHPLVFPLYGKKDLFAEERDFNMIYLNRLTPYLESCDVTLCLENLYDWDNGNIREIYISRAENLFDYVNRLDEKYFGVCLDTGHLHMFGGGMKEAVGIFGKRLKVLHIHDNDGVKDQHLFPRMGTIDWNGFLTALKKAGYRGTLNLELKPLPYVAASLKAFEFAKALTLGLD